MLLPPTSNRALCLIVPTITLPTLPHVPRRRRCLRDPLPELLPPRHLLRRRHATRSYRHRSPARCRRARTRSHRRHRARLYRCRSPPPCLRMRTRSLPHVPRRCRCLRDPLTEPLPPRHLLRRRHATRLYRYRSPARCRRTRTRSHRRHRAWLYRLRSPPLCRRMRTRSQLCSGHSFALLSLPTLLRADCRYGLASHLPHPTLYIVLQPGHHLRPWPLHSAPHPALYLAVQQGPHRHPWLHAPHRHRVCTPYLCARAAAAHSAARCAAHGRSASRGRSPSCAGRTPSRGAARRDRRRSVPPAAPGRLVLWRAINTIATPVYHVYGRRVLVPPLRRRLPHPPWSTPQQPASQHSSPAASVHRLLQRRVLHLPHPQGVLHLVRHHHVPCRRRLRRCRHLHHLQRLQADGCTLRNVVGRHRLRVVRPPSRPRPPARRCRHRPSPSAHTHLRTSPSRVSVSKCVSLSTVRRRA